MPSCSGMPLRALPLVALALLTLIPAPGRTQSSLPPAVDLSSLQVRESRVTASAGEERALLTLNADLQRASERLLARARPVEGAIVVADVSNGHLLAWAEAGKPGVIARADSPSASLFKLITTAALLERGSVTPAQKVCTHGGQRRIERRHLDAPRKGPMTCAPFFGALGHSRNAVYAQLVTRHLTRSDLLEVAEHFGFNRDLPFDLPAVTGQIELPYNDLAFARAAAGFEHTRLSPLGALELAFIVASGGEQIRLRIVSGVGDYRAPKEREVVGRVLQASTAETLRRMMEVTVHSGTSRSAFTDAQGKSYLGSIRVAGKTGTLQPSPEAPTTTWFVGFAPSRRPEVVLAVKLDNGKVWRQKANEVARDVLRIWFSRRGRPGISDPFASAVAAAPRASVVDR